MRTKKRTVVVVTVLALTLSIPLGAWAAPGEGVESREGWWAEAWSWVVGLVQAGGGEGAKGAGPSDSAETGATEGDEEGGPTTDPDG